MTASAERVVLVLHRLNDEDFSDGTSSSLDQPQSTQSSETYPIHLKRGGTDGGFGLSLGYGTFIYYDIFLLYKFLPYLTCGVHTVIAYCSSMHA